MFSSAFKRPALALAVTAGLLAVAGPASAATSDRPSLKGDGNDVTIETAKIVYNGHAGLGSAGLKFDSNEWAEDLGFTALPETHANDNAFLPEVNDEVLASVNLELDYIEGTQ